MTPYCSRIINALPPQAQGQARDWVKGKPVSANFVTIFSQETANQRYRFSPQEGEIIQMIFNKAIEEDPLLLIEGNGWLFSKKDIQIAFLRGIGRAMTLSVIKLCHCFCAALISYRMARSAYKWTEHAIAAHAVPFIINRTSINTMRIFNNLIGNSIYYRNIIRDNSIYIIIYISLGRWFVGLLPATITESKLAGYVDSAVRTAHTIIRFLSPATQGTLLFCLRTTWDGVTFAWRGSEAVGQILFEIADKWTHSEREKMKEERFQCWQKEILAFRKAQAISHQDEVEIPYFLTGE